MRIAVAIIAIGLAATLPHFGAMAGSAAASAFEGGHSAHAGHEVPLMPTCPIGYVCPALPNPVAGAAAAMTLLFFAVAVFLAARFIPALPVWHPAFTGPPIPPNGPKSLLSVFKKE